MHKGARICPLRGYFKVSHSVTFVFACSRFRCGDFSTSLEMTELNTVPLGRRRDEGVPPYRSGVTPAKNSSYTGKTPAGGRGRPPLPIKFKLPSFVTWAANARTRDTSPEGEGISGYPPLPRRNTLFKRYTATPRKPLDYPTPTTYFDL